MEVMVVRVDQNDQHVQNNGYGDQDHEVMVVRVDQNDQQVQNNGYGDQDHGGDGGADQNDQRVKITVIWIMVLVTMTSTF